MDWGRDRRGWIQGKRKGFPERKEEEEEEQTSMWRSRRRKNEDGAKAHMYSISRSKSARYRLNFLYFAEVGYLLAFLPCLRKKAPSGGIRARPTQGEEGGKTCEDATFALSPPPLFLLLFPLLLWAPLFSPYSPPPPPSFLTR